MKQIINENLLKSDFTFGFELEGCVEGDYLTTNSQETGDSDIFADGDNSDELDMHINELFNIYGQEPGWGELQSDCSIRTNSPYDATFEWASPVMTCTPANFKRTINFLSHLSDIGIYTNNSCGFHHHLSYKGITERDMIWIYCNICMDTDFIEKMKYVDDYSFDDKQWASSARLDDMREAIESDAYTEVLHLLSDDKYRMFRIHPYGTIEWRGPRNFLNDGDLRVIKDFYKKFNYYISKVIDYQKSNILWGTSSLDKKTFFEKLINASKQESQWKNDDRELEFLSRTHGYNDRPLDYKTEKNVLLADPEKFAEALNDDLELFYTLLYDEDIGIKLLLRKNSYFLQNLFDKLYEAGDTYPEQTIKHFINVVKNSDVANKFNMAEIFRILGKYINYVNSDLFIELMSDNINDMNEFINYLSFKEIRLDDEKLKLFYMKMNLMFEDTNISSIENLISNVGMYLYDYYLPNYLIKFLLWAIKKCYINDINHLFKDRYNNHTFKYALEMNYIENNIGYRSWNNHILGMVMNKPHLYHFLFLLFEKELSYESMMAIMARLKVTSWDDEKLKDLDGSIIENMKKYYNGEQN